MTAPHSATLTFLAPSVSSDTILRFNLTVTDNRNAISIPATVSVTVKHINRPPVANAGQDQTVNAGDNVTLNGSGSTDPDGNITSYSWTQIAGPPGTLNDADTAAPTFTAPF